MTRFHLALLTSAMVAFGGALWGAEAAATWQAIPREQVVLSTDALVGMGAGLVTLSALLGVPQRRRRRREPDPWEW